MSETPSPETSKPDSKPSTSSPVLEQIVTTEHKLQVGKNTLHYQATCGTVVLREPDSSEPEGKGQFKGDKARASVFFIAYTLKNKSSKAAEQRPITFSFNGGPGSSSVWLHLGILGPQRVPTDEMGQCGAPPYGLTENEHTLLTDSDLVFIDPVGTGHSRVAEGEKMAEFHDYQRDLDSVGEFIRLYLTRHGRWASPKYLIGESYGTTRAAGLSRHLQDKHNIHVNGLMLVSLAVDFQTLSFDHGNELPYPLFLPTYAATAWYHKALSPAMQKKSLKTVVAEAEAFANGDYLLALHQGSKLGTEERQRIAEGLARFSGLSAAYLLRCDLRPTEFRFFKELLRERGQTVGRLDSRFLGLDRDDAGEQAEEDAGMNNLVGAYAVGINRLLFETLQFKSDSPYKVISPLWQSWTWKGFENKYVNVGDSLRRALHASPTMRVYVASGYYDLATPHAAGDYTLNHLGLRPPLQGQIQVSYFEAGHMMYIHQPSLARMAQELRLFVRADSASPKKSKGTPA
ncbi:peptidase S10 [Paucibacter sp. KBW04]|uniref:S10 family peptidase n=1 Tax=Paucibacter sp. KBW04 TaxID=2153361 RepID=UPI000F5653DF|nr:peptidase S10 [Paucibacter sp. KBW04]RQO63024.1 peptidase S10 [Paucibacter sp. KBW04]